MDKLELYYQCILEIRNNGANFLDDKHKSALDYCLEIICENIAREGEE